MPNCSGNKSSISINAPDSILLTSFTGTGGSPAPKTLLWDEVGGVVLLVAEWSAGGVFSYETDVTELAL